MSNTDIYQRDPNRILVHTSTGHVQAWKPEGDDVAICMALTAGIKHKGDTQSWIGFTQYMTAAEARDLAVVLTQAADHVEALAVVDLEDA